MSFTLIQQATPRLHRSELAVPGSNPSLFEKAAKGAAESSTGEGPSGSKG